MEGGALLLFFFPEGNEWLVNGLHPTLKVGYIWVRTHLLAIYIIYYNYPSIVVNGAIKPYKWPKINE